MKINNDQQTQGVGPSEAGRTQGAMPTSPGHTVAGRRVDAAEGDSVEISGISAQLADASAVDGQQRANRVAELAAMYGRGQYHVNAAELSGALVSHALGAAESK